MPSLSFVSLDRLAPTLCEAPGAESLPVAVHQFFSPSLTACCTAHADPFRVFPQLYGCNALTGQKVCFLQRSFTSSVQPSCVDDLTYLPNRELFRVSARCRVRQSPICGG